MNKELKVRHLLNDIYQVIEFTLSGDEFYKYEDEYILYEGSLSNCEVYIRLSNSDLLI